MLAGRRSVQEQARRTQWAAIKVSTTSSSARHRIRWGPTVASDVGSASAERSVITIETRRERNQIGREGPSGRRDDEEKRNHESKHHHVDRAPLPQAAGDTQPTQREQRPSETSRKRDPKMRPELARTIPLVQEVPHRLHFGEDRWIFDERVRSDRLGTRHRSWQKPG